MFYMHKVRSKHWTCMFLNHLHELFLLSLINKREILILFLLYEGI